MGSKIEYVDGSQIRATAHARNSRAVGVLWAVFAVCYAVVAAVAFAAPDWVGTGDGVAGGTGAGGGRIGLWAACLADDEDGSEVCTGRLDQFMNQGVAFQAATAFVGLAVVTAVLTICAMILFFFCHSTTVYHVCAWIQLVSAVCLITACACFPAGWSDASVRRVCGPSAGRYALGTCGVRWAYLLAAVGCLDAVVLATLAFVLAARHVRLQPEPPYAAASLFKGEMNSAFVGDAGSIAGSRKSLSSLHHQPVLLLPPGGQDDAYSQFSQRTVPRSVHSGHYSHPHSLHRGGFNL